MIPSTRRQFLKLSFLSLMYYFSDMEIGRASKSPDKRTYQGKVVMVDAESMYVKDKRRSSEESFLYSYDLETGKKDKVVVPLGLPHGIVQLPQEQSLLILEGDGDRACIINKEDWSIVRTIKLEDGFVFSGHGAVTPDQRSIFLPVFRANSWSQSKILEYELVSWTKAGEFSAGIHPHQPMFDGSEWLYVTDYGEEIPFAERKIHGSLIKLDMDSKKVIQKTYGPLNNQRVCHLEKTKSGVFVNTNVLWELSDKMYESKRLARKNPTTYRKIGPHNGMSFGGTASPLYFLNNKKFFPNKPNDFQNARTNVSLAYNLNSDIVGSVHSYGKFVSFWRGTKRVNEFKFKNETPRGISIEKNVGDFVITTSEGTLYLFDSNSGELCKKLDWPETREVLHVHSYCI